MLGCDSIGCGRTEAMYDWSILGVNLKVIYDKDILETQALFIDNLEMEGE